MARVGIYSEKRLTPVTLDILGGLFEKHPEVTDVYTYDVFSDPTTPTLVLGNLPERMPLTYVKTLSQPQIATNPAAITELSAALKLLLHPFDWPEVDYTVVSRLTPGQIKSLGQYIAIDIEVGGDIDTDLPSETWLLSCGLFDGTHCYVYDEWSLNPSNPDNALAQLYDLIRFSGRRFITHNGQFDYRTLTAWLPGTVEVDIDTLLIHHALNHGAKEHGLKPTAMHFLGAPDWEGGIKQYLKGMSGHYERIPRYVLYKYNAGDVIWTWRLYFYFLPALASDDRLANLARHEFAMSRFYQYVEDNGLGVDLEYIDYLDSVFTGQYENAVQRLRDIADDPKFNGNSPQQVKRWLNGHGVMVKSTGEKILEKLTLPDGSGEQQFVDILLEVRGLSKKIGTYVNGIRKRTHNGVIHSTFKVFGTTTGRLSSANPNVQNLPRDEEGQLSLRRIYVSRDQEHRSFVECDYSQAELRVMADMSGDPYLISLFQPGMPDFFDSLMPIAYPREDRDAWDVATRKNKRARLKAVVYGLSYGRQAEAIAADLKMPVKEARAIIVNYARAAPVFWEWREEIKRTVLDPERALISPFGRQFQSEVITDRGRNGIINSGLSFLPQSTASDLLVTAAFAVRPQLEQYDAFICNTIHDAILAEVPDQYIEEVGHMMQYEMTTAAFKVFQRVPFDAEFTYGKSWEGI